MKQAYRVARELLRDRVRSSSPETLEILEQVRQADVIVVEGSYDRIQDVLEMAGMPFTAVNPERFDKSELRPDQIVFVNCPGNLSPKALHKLEAFVREGGFLFTTDWAVRNVLEHAFPGFVEFNDRPTGDEVVRIELLDREDPMLKTVLDANDDPQWWLEASSYPIRVLDPQRVKVLIRSKEIEQRHGDSPVLVTFSYGEGTVYHMISHFYLQRTETRTARHAAPSMTYVAEKGVDQAGMWKYRELGAEGLTTGQLQSALSSNTIILGVLLRHQTRDLRRSQPDE